MQNSGPNLSGTTGVQIVFFGTEDFSLAALRALVENGYKIALVVTKPDSPKGRGMHVSEPVVKAFAREHSIPIIQPARLSEIHESLMNIPNRIGVLSSFGKIIPQATLDLFERGIVNIHPSLLPKYRGPSPIETAIYDGETQTGVTLIRLVKTMDAGPIYDQVQIYLPPTIRAKELYDELAKLGAELLIKDLPAIINGTLIPRPQDESKVILTRLLERKGEMILPDIMTAAEIVRHVHAYELYPRTKYEYNGISIRIIEAHVGDGVMTIAAQDNYTVSIDRLMAPSGKVMTAAEFLRGYAHQ